MLHLVRSQLARARAAFGGRRRGSSQGDIGARVLALSSGAEDAPEPPTGKKNDSRSRLCRRHVRRRNSSAAAAPQSCRAPRPRPRRRGGKRQLNQAHADQLAPCERPNERRALSLSLSLSLSRSLARRLLSRRRLFCSRSQNTRPPILRRHTQNELAKLLNPFISGRATAAALPPPPPLSRVLSPGAASLADNEFGAGGNWPNVRRLEAGRPASWERICEARAPFALLGGRRSLLRELATKIGSAAACKCNQPAGEQRAQRSHRGERASAAADKPAGRPAEWKLLIPGRRVYVMRALAGPRWAAEHWAIYVGRPPLVVVVVVVVLLLAATANSLAPTQTR